MTDDIPQTEPLLIEAREVLAAINIGRNCPEDGPFVRGYREGQFDDHDDIEIALAALRRGIELAYPSLLNGLREAREALAVVYEWADQFANGALWHFRDQEPAKAAKVTLAHLDTLLAQEGEG